MKVNGQPNPWIGEPSAIRFGRRARPEEVGTIQKTAQDVWKVKSVDSTLCFSEAESGIPVWKDIKRFFGRMMDGLRRRWTFYRRGYGMFPKYFPEPVDVYTLKKFPSEARASEVFKQLQEVEGNLKEVKQNLTEWSRSGRRFRDRIENRLNGLDASAFGISQGWLNPFSILQPFKLPKVKVNFKEPLGPEHFAPTVQVLQLDNTTLLTRTRLGPHIL